MKRESKKKQLEVLVLAPHPFFINRGTPIDAYLVVKALSERENIAVDMIVYPEGEDVQLPKITIHRVPFCRGIKNIRPGFSFKKLCLDFVMFFFTWKMVHQKKYSILHAGEEAVFIAMFIKAIYKIPYVYDLDSSIAQQLVEKNGALKIFAPIFNWFEKKAIQHAIANAPVCNALKELCEKNGSQKTVTLHDISQLKKIHPSPTGLLRKNIKGDATVVLYCGNLEKYQGVDLLIESFPYALKRKENIALVIIGGVPEDIQHYKEKAADLQISEKVYFLGPKPFEHLGEYLADADILVAPRIKGVNTPMKIFPYLHSGKAVLLTNLYTHTQIVSNKEAFLADPVPDIFGEAIATLALDEELRNKLGRNGKIFVEKNHVYSAHKKRIDQLYDWIVNRLKNNSDEIKIKEEE